MVRIRQGSVRYRPVRATSLARCAARVIAMAYAEGVRRVSLGGLETVVVLPGLVLRRDIEANLLG